jgi:hypothetical protein
MQHEIKIDYEWSLGFAVVSLGKESIKVMCGKNFDKNLKDAENMINEHYFADELMKTLGRLYNETKSNDEKIALWKVLSRLGETATDILEVPKEMWGKKNGN